MLSTNKIKTLIALLIIGNATLFTYYNLTDKNQSKQTSPVIPNIKQLVLLNERNTIVKEKEAEPTPEPLAIKKVAPEALKDIEEVANKKQSETIEQEVIEVVETTIVETQEDLQEAKTTPKEEPKPIIEEPINKTLCYTIGPFEKRADKTHTQNQFGLLAIDSSERIILEKEISSYFIFIPPHKTRKAAKITIAKLKKRNVRDFYIIRTGMRENGIALGLFSQEKHANKRYDLLKKLYFNVKIEIRYKDKEIYWLDYKAKESVINQLDIQSLSPLPLQLYLRKC